MRDGGSRDRNGTRNGIGSRNDSGNQGSSKDKPSIGEAADRLWNSFYPVPFCFMGMGIFRVWTEMLYSNGQMQFPAQQFVTTFLSFDAYSYFDFIATFVLILLSLFAKQLAPLYRHGWVIATTAVCMVGAVCVNFFSILDPSAVDILRWPAIVLGAVGVALILMLWSEFFGCIDPVRIAAYYSASIAVSCVILWMFKGLSFYWVWIGTCAVPIVSLLCLWRAYHTLPDDAYPPMYQGDFSFPWKPVIVMGLYSVVYGLRGGIFTNALSIHSGIGAFVSAMVVYLAISARKEEFDFSLLWKIAVPLMLISLAPLDAIVPGWAHIADFCALASYTTLLILIMVILGNLSFRYGVCALWVFAIERAVRMVATQTGRILGLHLAQLELSALIDYAVLLGMAIALAFVAMFFFSEKQVTSQWGVVLKQPMADDRELYLEKNRLGIKCRELATKHGLTSREEETLLLIAQKKHLSQIADELCVSSNTVKTHIRHVYEKLGVQSRSEIFELLGVKR